MTPRPFALGYGTNGFTDHPLEDALDVLENEGYDAVALTLGFPHLDPFGPDWATHAAQLRQRLEGMRGGTGMAVVIETGTRFLLDPYRKHRPTLVDVDAQARMAYMERAIEIAAVLKARCVSFFSGVLPEGVSPDHGRALLLERLPLLVEHARAHDVALSLEPEPGMLVETVSDALDVLSSLGTPPELGITVDVGHCLVVEPEGVVGALRAAADHLMNVQLDDMPHTHHEHRPFGEGEIDLPLVMRTLAEIDYRAVAAVELPRHSYDAPGLARRSMGALRQAWDDREPREGQA
ncbi:sugar phosphate isomerase/epimerase family protein [Demequina sp. SO4-18]|uniref:sugar phosphate isomerase/epimerase family protein n=1 Tax=Demequina sp. SO4-18 TaxID=3401026 RepID=UPI003B59031F